MNLDKLQNIVHDEEHEEFVCNLVSQKNIEISKSQKESLIACTENYSGYYSFFKSNSDEISKRYPSI